MKFCKVADITDWRDSEFQSISSLLELDDFKDRKVWEHIQVYKGLRHLGLLNENTRAIGLGVGQERLIYAFANTCQQVIATDLYNSQNWQTAAMPLEEVYEKNTFPYQRERLIVRNMDMTQIDYPDDSFDFVWSCCAIEHVNSFSDLHRVYREIHRVLKPGGIAALTTEYNMTEQHSYEPNMLFTDRYWIEHWLMGDRPLLQGFDLIDQPDLALAEDPGNQPQPRRQQLKTSVPIYSRDIVLNSIAFFLRKSGEFSGSYEDRWLPDTLSTYLSACDQQKRQDFPASEQILQSLLQDTSLSPRLRLAAIRRLVAALQAQGKTEAMVSWCQEVVPLSQDANDTDHLLPLANQCKKIGLWDEARILYNKVACLPGARDVQVVRSLLGQAEVFAHQQEYETALQFAEQAAENLPIYRLTSEIASVHHHRGLYSEKLGKLPEAIAAYQLAIAAASPGSKLHASCLSRIETCSRSLEEQRIHPSQGFSRFLPPQIKTWFRR